MESGESLALRRFDSAAAFYDRAGPFLARHEAMHCLPIGICTSLIQGGEWAADLYFATVEDGNGVVVAALRTPPHNVVLSLAHSAERAPAALDLLARDLRAGYGELPGVIGPAGVSRRFTETWRGRSGQPFELAMRQRIYQLETVRPVEGIPGQFRRANQTDRGLLARWMDGFNREALGENDQAAAERWAESVLASPTRGAYLWEDREPVAMVAHGGPTPRGMRIGPVYTPPEHRRHGYASAATAALSQLLLDSGRRFCFLFTDLANPTSNHIYQAIGYEPVGDVAVYRFR